jgi:hypothetical protein
MKEQTTNHILMVRPANFGYNAETAMNNRFQEKPADISAEDIQKLALIEFDNFVFQLEKKGVNVMVVEDTEEPMKPDAIYPNNWFTTHRDGSFITYPMYAKSRRLERREEIINQIGDNFTIANRYSFEQYEEEDKFLEGTGSMVLDREKKIVYACLSPRTDVSLVDKFCLLKGYKKEVFTATDEKGEQVYHTNVMMTLGSQIAIVCFEAIDEEEERSSLLKLLNNSGKGVIEITRDQMSHFAGNMIELHNEEGEPLFVMSHQARKSLNKSQMKKLNDFATVIAPDIPTIEKYGGGSVRCMIAEIFLSEL